MNSVLNKINRKLLVNTIFNNSLCIRATSTRTPVVLDIMIMMIMLIMSERMSDKLYYVRMLCYTCIFHRNSLCPMGIHIQITGHNWIARSKYEACGEMKHHPDVITSSISLSEVGILESPKQQGKYETGQMFLHKLFGYRGVVLFPWIGRIYDRDITSEYTSPNTSGVSAGERLAYDSVAVETMDAVDADVKPGDAGDGTHGLVGGGGATRSSGASHREVKGQTHTYYQSLMDARDAPYIKVGTESVTFLSHQDTNGTLYSIPGIDYVAHEDMIPYTTTESPPIDNIFFDKFLDRGQNGGKDTLIARSTLLEWQEKNHVWLELTDVHRETTENIRVTVMPFFIGTREVNQQKVYWWRYSIRIENLGDTTVQLRERHWRIFSLSGTLETVRGRGVIGKEPVFNRKTPAFQYTSHVSLQSQSGHMWGTFKMERADGSNFECRIPPFSLESRFKSSDIESTR